jgi:competence protein ComEC
LDLADPSIAVISAGKSNPYGHPSKQTLDMLKAKKIKIFRTDKDDDIVFNLKE